MAIDTVIQTANSLQEPDAPAAPLLAANVLVTPTGGTQAKLGDLLGSGGENPTFTGLTVTGNMTVTKTTLGMFGATAVTQPTAAAQASITDGSIGTANPTTGVGALVGATTFLVPVTMASLANAQVFQIDPGFNGKLTAINFRDTVAVTTGSKAATVQAQVNATNLTGGVISLSGTYAVGAAQAGTAITAGTQTFTSAQTVGFSVSSVTA